MIYIYYPDNFHEERKYIIEVLFKYFIRIPYKTYVSKEKDYKIVLENKKNIVIKDSFFSYQEDGNYLKYENIPTEIKFLKNPFIIEENVPVLFGTNQLEIEENKIILGIDIFSSAFFMLTRWEEFVNKKRDLHNRFSAKYSIAYKNDFLHRPIVNEYAEMLWNMLKYLGIEEERKSRRFEFIITHDVDSIRFWNSNKKIFTVLLGDLLKRKNLIHFTQHINDIIQIKSGKRKDPFDTFDYLMDLSESVNIKSRFYFMSGGLTKFDNRYNIKSSTALKILQNIKKRGHVIGFHPSYNAYNNSLQWKKEKELLEEVVSVPIKEGRQHYLRFEVPLTWEIWMENNMEMDCTLGYADREGFRCGTCYEYPVFDFIKRKKLTLMEYPLIVMEANFNGYQNIEPGEMYNKTKKLLDVTKKYKGNFVYLWHNSSFNTPNWRKFNSVYEKIVECKN